MISFLNLIIQQELFAREETFKEEVRKEEGKGRKEEIERSQKKVEGC